MNKMNKDRIKKGLYWQKGLSLVEGCKHAGSPSCDNCWSASQTHTRASQTNPKIKARYGDLTNEKGQFNGKIRLMWNDIEKPLKVKKPTVWSIWNDLFGYRVPVRFIDNFLNVVDFCKQHTFLVLTKISVNISNGLYGYDNISGDAVCRKLNEGDYYKNLYVGVTVENQNYIGRIDALISSYKGPKFLSIEPMLLPINIEKYLPEISSVICGGESGKNARELNLDWVRDLRDQCIRTNTPFFFKQASGFRPEKLPELDGKVWDQLAWVKWKNLLNTKN